MFIFNWDRSAGHPGLGPKRGLGHGCQRLVNGGDSSVAGVQEPGPKDRAPVSQPPQSHLLLLHLARYYLLW